MAQTLTPEEMIARHLAKLETLEGRTVNFEDSASIHHAAIAAALILIQDQQKRITNLERLAIILDREARTK